MDNEDKILARLTEIYKDVLDDENLTLNAETTANDISEWDSVNHLILIYAIEESYKIKFDLGEMINFRSVGDICQSISRKIV